MALSMPLFSYSLHLDWTRDVVRHWLGGGDFGSWSWHLGGLSPPPTVKILATSLDWTLTLSTYSILVTIMGCKYATYQIWSRSLKNVTVHEEQRKKHKHA